MLAVFYLCIFEKKASSSTPHTATGVLMGIKWILHPVLVPKALR